LASCLQLPNLVHVQNKEAVELTITIIFLDTAHLSHQPRIPRDKMPTRASTSNTPQRQSRRHNNFKENINFFEPGKQGRRTGLVLKDSGLRDEHGFEPVSGIFSSPEPSPQQPSAQRLPPNANDTALGSSEMVLQDSTKRTVSASCTQNMR